MYTSRAIWSWRSEQSTTSLVWIDQGNWIFPVCLRARLRIWFRQTATAGSVVPSRVSPFILHAQAEPDMAWSTYITLSDMTSGFWSRIPEGNFDSLTCAKDPGGPFIC